MSRSLKKGPYVEERLFNRVCAQMDTTDKKLSKRGREVLRFTLNLSVRP